jgi:hypothetical protein
MGSRTRGAREAQIKFELYLRERARAGMAPPRDRGATWRAFRANRLKKPFANVREAAKLRSAERRAERFRARMRLIANADY